MIKENKDIKVIVFRRPNMFKVNENMFNMVGVGELEKLFTIENYECQPQELALYYPERFLNIVEKRALIERIINAKNYAKCQIITSDVIIIQHSMNVSIAKVEGELTSEEQFQLSWDECGMPNDSGLSIL